MKRKKTPGSGRTAGTLNKATREVRELSQKLVTDPAYQANLLERLREGRAGALEPVLWHYAFGKPRESVSLSAEQPVSVTFGGRYKPGDGDGPPPADWHPLPRITSPH